MWRWFVQFLERRNRHNDAGLEHHVVVGFVVYLGLLGHGAAEVAGGNREGTHMSTYIVAFIILVAAIVLVKAAMMLSVIPRIRSHREVRRFHKALANLDLVALSWRDSLDDGFAVDEVPDQFPAARRPRRGRKRGAGGRAEPIA
jgi:hypothetical protein